MPLAFPNHGGYTSSEYTMTPFSPAEEIPIDPQLVDPQLQDEHSPSDLPRRSPTPHTFSPVKVPNEPYGDPFAQQFCIPREPTPPLPVPRPLKRKRKRAPQREDECSFCEGTDTRNKENVPEEMISCSNCGRSGHPTCLHITKILDNARAWDWKCIECKDCEICQKKGDDTKILFCDNCDRGWHMYCLNPALEEPPAGIWVCPACPPEAAEWLGNLSPSPPPNGLADFAEELNDAGPTDSESPSKRPRGRPKGKQKATEAELQEHMHENAMAPPPKPPRKRDRERERERRQRAREAQAATHTETPATQKRPLRIRGSSPSVVTPSNTTQRMVVRLRLPAKAAVAKEEEAPNPFEEILPRDKADITRSMITQDDKARFEKSRIAVEDKVVIHMPGHVGFAQASTSQQPPATPTHFPQRPLRSLTSLSVAAMALDSPTPSSPGPPGSPAPGASSTTPLRIRCIRFGEFEINTWYDAPFPEEYSTVADGRLWVCEFCLKYMKSKFGAVRHRMKCKARHPPGDEIYRDSTVSVFEVDGRKNKIYCQNLCLLSKMFLDHKSLFYDVEPFLFYVMTETDDIGARFVGYFSKEKRSPKDFNVSCIMTLPVRQRRGWGNLLIDFSYLLSKKETRLGTPERPLSALGALSYRSYWTLVLMMYLRTAPDGIRMEDMCTATAMKMEDVFATLREQDMITVRESTPPPIRPAPGTSIKYKRNRAAGGSTRRNLTRQGTSTSTTRDDDEPPPIPTTYELKWDRAAASKFVADWEKKGYLRLKPERLKWSPFLLARGMRKSEMVIPAVVPSASDPDHVNVNGMIVPSVPLANGFSTVAESMKSEVASTAGDLPPPTRRATSTASSGVPPSPAFEIARLARPSPALSFSHPQLGLSTIGTSRVVDGQVVYGHVSPSPFNEPDVTATPLPRPSTPTTTTPTARRGPIGRKNSRISRRSSAAPTATTDPHNDEDEVEHQLDNGISTLTDPPSVPSPTKPPPLRGRRSMTESPRKRRRVESASESSEAEAEPERDEKPVLQDSLLNGSSELSAFDPTPKVNGQFHQPSPGRTPSPAPASPRTPRVTRALSSIPRSSPNASTSTLLTPTSTTPSGQVRGKLGRFAKKNSAAGKRKAAATEPDLGGPNGLFFDDAVTDDRVAEALPSMNGESSTPGTVIPATPTPEPGQTPFPEPQHLTLPMSIAVPVVQLSMDLDDDTDAEGEEDPEA